MGSRGETFRWDSLFPSTATSASPDDVSAHQRVQGRPVKSEGGAEGERRAWDGRGRNQGRGQRGDHHLGGGEASNPKASALCAGHRGSAGHALHGGQGNFRQTLARGHSTHLWLGEGGEHK